MSINKLFTIVLLVFFGSACTNSNMSYKEAKNTNTEKYKDIILPYESNYVVDAQGFNELEKRMAELAIENGYSIDIVEFSREMKEKHESLEKDIEKFAKKNSIVLPQNLKKEHEVVIEKLKSAEKVRFDELFIKTLTAQQEKNKSLYNEMIDNAKHKVIKKFAKDMLSSIESHHERTQEMSRKIYNPVND